MHIVVYLAIAKREKHEMDGRNSWSLLVIILILFFFCSQILIFDCSDFSDAAVDGSECLGGFQ